MEKINKSIDIREIVTDSSERRMSVEEIECNNGTTTTTNDDDNNNHP